MANTGEGELSLNPSFSCTQFSLVGQGSGGIPPIPPLLCISLDFYLCKGLSEQRLPFSFSQSRLLVELISLCHYFGGDLFKVIFRVCIPFKVSSSFMRVSFFQSRYRIGPFRMTNRTINCWWKWRIVPIRGEVFSLSFSLKGFFSFFSLSLAVMRGRFPIMTNYWWK